MKIGIVTDAVDYKQTGIGVYVENLIENLLKIDKKNEYVLIHHGKSENPLYKKAREVKYPFISTIPIMIQDSIFFSLTKEKFDIVHKPNPTGFLFPVKFPTIVTIHDLSYIHYRELSNRVHQFLYYQLVKKTLFESRSIIADSEYTKKDAVETFRIPEEKVTTIYLGASDYFRKLKHQEINSVLVKKFKLQEFILYVGTIEPRKNIINLVKAFEVLKSKGYPFLKLVLVGKKGYKSDPIFKRIAGSSFKSDIVMTGFIDRKELLNLYNLAIFCVYPSFFEGFGLPALEAMQCGCPVVTSSSSSLPEVIGSAGFKIDSNNVSQLSKSMERLLEDKNLRENLARKGLEQAKKFRWRKTAEQTLQIYERIGKKK